MAGPESSAIVKRPGPKHVLLYENIGRTMPVRVEGLHRDFGQI